jgi:chromosome segregation ATPase
LHEKHEVVKETNGATHLNGSAEQNEADDIDGIKKLAAAFKAQVVNAQEGSKKLRDSVGVLKTKEKDVQTELDQLKSDADALKRANEELQAKNKEQASRIQTLETNIGNQRTHFHEIRKTLEAISGPLENTYTDITGMVSELQRCVEFI